MYSLLCGKKISLLSLLIAIPLAIFSAVYHPHYLWKNGQTIRVGFQNDVPKAYKEKIEEIASIYEQYAYIDFIFSDDRKVHILIGEETYTNPYSRVGKLQIRDKSGDITMNLPLQDRFEKISSFDDEDYHYRSFKRTILHEFGHALGLQHEHQNPDANICWDIDAMNSYCTSNNISCNNYLALDLNGSLRYSVYDRHSIMHYQIDNQPTFCDYESPFTYNLSSLDKRWINIMYPFKGEVNPNQEMIVHLNSLSIEALKFDDEYIFGSALELYGEIGFTSRKDIGEDCYSDLSNCYHQSHNYNTVLLDIDEDKSLEFSADTPHYRNTNLGSLSFGINDEYFLHITLFEKDVVTDDDAFSYTKNSMNHYGDILVPIDNLYWKDSWTCIYELSEHPFAEPQFKLSLKLQLAD